VITTPAGKGHPDTLTSRNSLAAAIAERNSH
jgi:hypothetical protein